MISQELLSLVLGIDVLRTDHIDNNTLYYDTEHKCLNLNLDTLGRLCKEWCLKQVDMFTMHHHQDTVSITIVIKQGTSYSSPSMSKYTELEAIVKATEWVAKEKGLL